MTYLPTYERKFTEPAYPWGWNESQGDRPVIVDTPHAFFKKAARFRVHDGTRGAFADMASENLNRRTEIAEYNRASLNTPAPGKTLWMGGLMWLPENLVAPTNNSQTGGWLYLWQTHHDGGTGQAPLAIRVPHSGNPARLQLQTQIGKGSPHLDLGPVATGGAPATIDGRTGYRFFDWMMGVLWHDDPTQGRILKFIMNGVEIHTNVAVGNLVTGQSVYPKMGVYGNRWKSGNTVSTGVPEPELIVYHTGFRVGPTQESITIPVDPQAPTVQPTRPGSYSRTESGLLVRKRRYRRTVGGVLQQIVAGPPKPGGTTPPPTDGGGGTTPPPVTGPTWTGMPRLKVVGKRTVTPDGQTVPLRGVNMHRDEFYLGQNASFEAAAIPHLANDWKGNVVLRGYAHAPVLGNNAGYLGGLDRIVDVAEANKVYVIFAARSEQANGHQYVGIPPTAAEDGLAALARRYKDRPHVMFAASVEINAGAPAVTQMPNDTQVRDYTIRCIDKIRSAGHPEVIVFSAAKNWGRDVRWAATNPIDRPNVVYKSHVYGPTETILNGTNGWDYPGWKQYVDPAVQANRAVFFGEFGWNQDEMSINDTINLLDYANSHDLGWAPWGYDESSPTLLAGREPTSPPSDPFGLLVRSRTRLNKPIPAPLASGGTTPPPPTPSTPFKGKRLYLDPQNPAKRWVDANPNHSYAGLIRDKIAGAPGSQWAYATTMGGQNARDWANQRRTAHGDTVGIIVLYNIPMRDLGSYSAGGAASAAEYRTWIGDILAGLGGRPTVILYEPDALAMSTGMSGTARSERIALMKESILRLRNAGHFVYIDAAGPRWKNVSQIVPLLQEVAAENAWGFALNVSNFVGTPELIAHGDAVVKAFTAGSLRYIIDTGRNGNGPSPDGEVINPLGRALGRPPGEAPTSPYCDAHVWIKTPGESDGANGMREFDGSVAPGAGTFWPAYAYKLAERAPWSTLPPPPSTEPTPTEPTQPTGTIPSATNRGVPSGTTLTANSATTVASGTTWTGQDFTAASFDLSGKTNVTFFRCKFRRIRLGIGDRSRRFIDCEFDGQRGLGAATVFGVGGAFLRCKVWNAARGVEGHTIDFDDSFSGDLWGEAASHSEAVLIGHPGGGAAGSFRARGSTLLGEYLPGAPGGGMSGAVACYNHNDGTFRWGPQNAHVIQGCYLRSRDSRNYSVFWSTSGGVNRMDNSILEDNIFLRAGAGQTSVPLGHADIGPTNYAGGTGNATRRNKYDTGENLPFPNSATDTGVAPKRDTAPMPGGFFGLAPVGFVPLSDAQAAAMVRPSTWEPRPANATANSTKPPVGYYPTGYDTMTNNDRVFQRVTGQYTGTTDEIIQWACAKWGLPDDLVRAVAIHESYWNQSAVGDNGDSFGIVQVRNSAHSGTFPYARDSTAFNLDYYCALMRGTYNGWDSGYGWLGPNYTAGDLRGTLGRWFTGAWHTPEGDAYADAVLRTRDERPWLAAGF